MRCELKIGSSKRVRTLRTGSSSSSSAKISRFVVPVGAEATGSAFGVARCITMAEAALRGATDLEPDRTLRCSIGGSWRTTDVRFFFFLFFFFLSFTPFTFPIVVAPSTLSFFASRSSTPGSVAALFLEFTDCVVWGCRTVLGPGVACRVAAGMVVRGDKRDESRKNSIGGQFPRSDASITPNIGQKFINVLPPSTRIKLGYIIILQSPTCENLYVFSVL